MEIRNLVELGDYGKLSVKTFLGQGEIYDLFSHSIPDGVIISATLNPYIIIKYHDGKNNCIGLIKPDYQKYTFDFKSIELPGDVIDVHSNPDEPNYLYILTEKQLQKTNVEMTKVVQSFTFENKGDDGFIRTVAPDGTVLLFRDVMGNDDGNIWIDKDFKKMTVLDLQIESDVHFVFDSHVIMFRELTEDNKDLDDETSYDEILINKYYDLCLYDLDNKYYLDLPKQLIERTRINPKTLGKEGVEDNIFVVKDGVVYIIVKYLSGIKEQFVLTPTSCNKISNSIKIANPRYGYYIFNNSFFLRYVVSSRYRPENILMVNGRGEEISKTHQNISPIYDAYRDYYRLRSVITIFGKDVAFEIIKQILIGWNDKQVYDYLQLLMNKERSIFYLDNKEMLIKDLQKIYYQ